MGIGVVPRAFNHIILKDSHFDVVELDERIYDIAQKYFFVKKSKNLNVFIGDGYDYVMNMTSEKYDMIILDAFMDLSQEICAPDTFVTERFVLKVRKHLNSNGVLIVNTLPQFCSKYSKERNLYHSIFGRIYIGTFFSNTILMTSKGTAPTKRQIESRIRYYEKVFLRIGTNARWIAQMFNNFKRYKRNPFYTQKCELFSYTFLKDDFCSI
jgi:spermidine synthase